MKTRPIRTYPFRRLVCIQTWIVVLVVWDAGDDRPSLSASSKRDLLPILILHHHSDRRIAARGHTDAILNAHDDRDLVVRPQPAERAGSDGVERAGDQGDRVIGGDPLGQGGVERGDVVDRHLDDLGPRRLRRRLAKPFGRRANGLHAQSGGRTRRGAGI